MSFQFSVGPRTILYVNSVSTRRLWHWNVFDGFCKYGRLVGYKGAEIVDSKCWFPASQLVEWPLGGASFAAGWFRRGCCGCFVVRCVEPLESTVLSVRRVDGTWVWTFFFLQLANSKSHLTMSALVQRSLDNQGLFFPSVKAGVHLQIQKYLQLWDGVIL